jgi:hypothetical protein
MRTKQQRKKVLVLKRLLPIPKTSQWRYEKGNKKG